MKGLRLAEGILNSIKLNSPRSRRLRLNLRKTQVQRKKGNQTKRKHLNKRKVNKIQAKAALHPRNLVESARAGQVGVPPRSKKGREEAATLSLRKRQRGNRAGAHLTSDQKKANLENRARASKRVKSQAGALLRRKRRRKKTKNLSDSSQEATAPRQRIQTRRKESKAQVAPHPRNLVETARVGLVVARPSDQYCYLFEQITFYVAISNYNIFS